MGAEVCSCQDLMYGVALEFFSFALFGEPRCARWKTSVGEDCRAYFLIRIANLILFSLHQFSVLCSLWMGIGLEK